MYCPGCGAESTAGLNYCKLCGTTLNAVSGPTESGLASKTLTTLSPIAFVSAVGLIGLFITIGALANAKIDDRVLIGVAAFGGATVVCVVGLLIWLLARLSETGRDSSRMNKGASFVASSSAQPQLQGPPISVPSITENTTRNFDPARPRDRSTSE